MFSETPQIRLKKDCFRQEDELSTPLYLIKFMNYSISLFYVHKPYLLNILVIHYVNSECWNNNDYKVKHKFEFM